MNVKLGKEPKWKLGLLGALALVAVYFGFSAFQSDSPSATARATSASRTPVRAANRTPDPVLDQPAAETRSRPGLRPESRRLLFTFKDKKADPTTTDPTLRRDLLAKLQSVTLAGGDRNLFTFGSAPIPRAPEPKINPMFPPQTPVAADPPKPSEPPPPPPPPPIPLKFYGYSNAQPGVKRAFFLQGEEISVAAEGDLVQKRYKVVKIGVNSCVMEDTHVNNNQQTLPLVEEQPG